jgi:hypothetical protein
MTEDLLELERGFWKAAGDGQFYREHMVIDGLCVLPVGVLGREDTMAAIAKAEPWQEFQFSDVTTLDLGDDEAALCYRAEASRGEEDGYVALISSVYTRVAGQWKLALHQQTPING